MFRSKIASTILGFIVAIGFALTLRGPDALIAFLVIWFFASVLTYLIANGYDRTMS